MTHFLISVLIAVTVVRINGHRLGTPDVAVPCVGAYYPNGRPSLQP